MSEKLTQKTTEILDRQNALFVKGDVDELIKDFSEKAILFTPEGILEGVDSIKKFYSDVTTNVLPPGSEFKLTKQEVQGEIAYIVWTAESEKYRFPLGTDTFVMRNGKIIAQTFAAKIEPKNN